MDFIDPSGPWENDFGSQMIIDKFDKETGIFSGTYSSTTGASGTYYVTGITDIQPSPEVNGQTLSFAISWRSHTGGNDNDIQYWCSGFAGIIQIDGSTGEQVMNTTYVMQKNTDPDDNWEGTLVYPLVYRRKK